MLVSKKKLAIETRMEPILFCWIANVRNILYIQNAVRACGATTIIIMIIIIICNYTFNLIFNNNYNDDDDDNVLI